MCSFRFEHDDDQLTSAVTTTVAHLLLHRRFVDELLGSGGSLTMKVSLHGGFNTGLDLSPETLRTICDLQIHVSVECFPDG
jgi:hypothetical protein